MLKASVVQNQHALRHLLHVCLIGQVLTFLVVYLFLIFKSVIFFYTPCIHYIFIYDIINSSTCMQDMDDNYTSIQKKPTF